MAAVVAAAVIVATTAVTTTVTAIVAVILLRIPVLRPARLRRDRAAETTTIITAAAEITAQDLPVLRLVLRPARLHPVPAAVMTAAAVSRRRPDRYSRVVRPVAAMTDRSAMNRSGKTSGRRYAPEEGHTAVL